MRVKTLFFIILSFVFVHLTGFLGYSPLLATDSNKNNNIRLSAAKRGILFPIEKRVEVTNNQQLDQMLSRANIRDRQGYTDEACDIYYKIIEDNSESHQAARACWFLAEIMLKTGEPVRAINAYKTLMKSKYANEYSPQLFLKTAECYFSINALGQALEVLKGITEKSFYGSRANILRSQIYEEAGDFEKALEEAEKAVAISGDDQTWTRLIELYLKSSDIQTLLANLKKSYSENTDSKILHDKLVRLYLALKKPSDAALIMETMKSNSANLRLAPAFYSRLAGIYLVLNKYDRALENLDAALKMSPGNLVFSVLAAECWFAKNMPDRAAQVLFNAIMNSRNMDDYAKVGGEFFGRKFFKNAEKVYLMAREKFKKQELFLDELLIIAVSEKKYDKAVKYLIKSVNGRFRNVYVMKKALETCFANNRPILEALEIAAEKNISEKGLLTWLVASEITKLNKKYDKTCQYLTRYGKLAKDSGQSLFRFGMELYSENRSEESITVFKKLMETFGVNSGFYPESMNKYLNIVLQKKNVIKAKEAELFIVSKFGKPGEGKNLDYPDFFKSSTGMKIVLSRAKLFLIQGDFKSCMICLDSLPERITYKLILERKIIKASAHAGLGDFEKALLSLLEIIIPEKINDNEYLNLLGRAYLLKAEIQMACNTIEAAQESLNRLTEKLGMTISAARALEYYRVLKQSENKKEKTKKYKPEARVLAKAVKAYLKQSKESFESLFLNKEYLRFQKNKKSLAGPLSMSLFADLLAMKDLKRRAVEYNILLADLWPDSSQSPISLYNAADIISRQINDKTSAAKAVSIIERLITVYPSSGVIAPARSIYAKIKKQDIKNNEK